MEELKAGRELDALIATKVMGFQLHREDCNSYWVDGDGLEPDHSNEFSTDIAAAWVVVEKMKEKGFACSIISGIAYDFVQFESPRLGKFCIDHSSGRTSVPRGICLAALKSIDQK